MCEKLYVYSMDLLEIRVEIVGRRMGDGDGEVAGAVNKAGGRCG